jgi:type II secretory pathway pseudopilin PulG
MVLIELMIAVSILSILIYGFLSMFDVQYRQMKGLNQRIETTELRSLALQSFTKSDVCTWQLQGQSVDLSAVTTTTPSPTVLTLPALHMGPPGSPILAQQNAILPGTQSDIWVSTIQFKDIYSTGNPGEYVGNLQINFDPTHLVIALKPVVVRRIVSVDTSTSKITNCGSPMQAFTKRYCNTYGNDPAYSSAGTDQQYMCATPDADGACHIDGSENSLGCFLTGMDDDSAKMVINNSSSPFTYTSSTGATYSDVSVPVGAGVPQKCEIMKDTAVGGWKIRAWFGCLLVTCSVTCIFNP